MNTALNPPTPKPSVAELKDRIEAGEYAPDPSVLAGAVLWKIGVVRRVRRDLTEGGHEADRSHVPRARRSARGSRPPIRLRPDPPF